MCAEEGCGCEKRLLLLLLGCRLQLKVGGRSSLDGWRDWKGGNERSFEAARGGGVLGK